LGCLGAAVRDERALASGLAFFRAANEVDAIFGAMPGLPGS